MSKLEVQNEYTKPKMSYAQLIAEALLTGRERMLTLNEIYIAINKKHPYYSLDASTGRNWQNAIRSVSRNHVHSYIMAFVLKVLHVQALDQCQNYGDLPCSRNLREIQIILT